MMTSVINVSVVGAGVIGLSTAVKLTEMVIPQRTLRVTLISDKFSPETTGDGSAGFWEPHLCGDTPLDKIKKWGKETFDYSVGLAYSDDAAQCGAKLLSGATYSRTPLKEVPFWKDIVFNFKDLSPSDLNKLPYLNKRGIKYGYTHQTTSLDCLKYLPWLRERFLKNGGSLQQKKISSISELAGTCDIVVNCTGIGARDLVPDSKVKAVRGQIVRVEAPWITHFVLDDQPDDIFYIIPKASHVVLGGTHEFDRYDTKVDTKERERILKGCIELEPSLKGAKIIEDWVGFRPSRDEIRLERELLITPKGKLSVVHNYGHGGAGVTLHWGCATEAVQLVRQCVMENVARL